MTQLLLRIFRAVTVTAIVWSPASVALAKKSPLRKDGAGPSKQDRVDYFACRKGAMAIAKDPSNPNREQETKRALSLCKEQFPSVAAFSDCKRNAIRSHRDNRKGFEAALDQCRTEYRRLAFDPESPLPFFVHKGRAFFGGAGLNIPRRLTPPAEEEGSAGSQFGNFKCSQLENVMFGNQEPEYLLFGNFLKTFRGFRQMKEDKIIELLGFKPKTPEEKKKARKARKARGKKAKGENFRLHPRFGQVFGVDTRQPLTAYFPLSYCHFDRDIGEIFSAIKVYYLLDKEKNYITPYFGAAFYKPEAEITFSELMEKTKAALGPDYKVSSWRPGVHYLAKGEVREFDYENDPINVCRGQNRKDFIAILKADKSQKQPEYLILSNVGNLCKYGNHLASTTVPQAEN